MEPTVPLPKTNWIRELAQPYLRGYKPRAAVPMGDLRGYFFDAPRAKGKAGFFAGYLAASEKHGYLKPLIPECLVFAYLEPGTALHRRLVVNPESLLRTTFGYIRWLTHRPPRFELYDAELTTLIRHRSMQDWPAERYEHYSRNFFIESFAWLVRSGLVRRLAAEAGAGTPGASPPKASRKVGPVSDSRRASRPALAKARQRALD